MRIGILGGTFDPIHFAHLLVAEDARALLALDRVVFVPNGAPPHRGMRTSASAEDRLRMVELATAPNPAFEVSRIEVDREGPSYAIHTLEALQRERPGADLFFLTGVDALAEVGTWYRSADVLQLATFVAAARPGYPLAQLEAVLPPETMRRVTPLATTDLAISATEIRRRVADGLPIRYLTPDPVEAYIRSHGLYRLPEAP